MLPKKTYRHDDVIKGNFWSPSSSRSRFRRLEFAEMQIERLSLCTNRRLRFRSTACCFRSSIPPRSFHVAPQMTPQSAADSGPPAANDRQPPAAGRLQSTVVGGSGRHVNLRLWWTPTRPPLPPLPVDPPLAPPPHRPLPPSARPRTRSPCEGNTKPGTKLGRAVRDWTIVGRPVSSAWSAVSFLFYGCLLCFGRFVRQKKCRLRRVASPFFFLHFFFVGSVPSNRIRRPAR